MKCGVKMAKLSEENRRDFEALLDGNAPNIHELKKKLFDIEGFATGEFEDGKTPLEVLVGRQVLNHGYLQQLVSQGADINKKTKDNKSILHLVLKRESPKNKAFTVYLLLRNGAQLGKKEVRKLKELKKIIDKVSQKVILDKIEEAIQAYEETAKVEEKLTDEVEEGAEVEEIKEDVGVEEDSDLDTEENDIKGVKMANLTQELRKQFEKACKYNDYESLLLILSVDGFVNGVFEDGQSPLEVLIRLKDYRLSMLTRVLKLGADVNKKTSDGKSLLMLVLEKDSDLQLFAISELLSCGAKIDDEEAAKLEVIKEKLPPIDGTFIAIEKALKAREASKILVEELSKFDRADAERVMQAIRNGADLSLLIETESGESTCFQMIIYIPSLRDQFDEILEHLKKPEVLFQKFVGQTVADRVYNLYRMTDSEEKESSLNVLKAIFNHTKHLPDFEQKIIRPENLQAVKELVWGENKLEIEAEVTISDVLNALKPGETNEVFFKKLSGYDGAPLRDSLVAQMDWTAYKGRKVTSDNLKYLSRLYNVFSFINEPLNLDITQYSDNVQKALFNIVAYTAKLDQEYCDAKKDSHQADKLSDKSKKADKFLASIRNCHDLNELKDVIETALADSTFTKNRGSGFYGVHGLFSKKHNKFSEDRHHYVRSTLEELALDLHTEVTEAISANVQPL